MRGSFSLSEPACHSHPPGAEPLCPRPSDMAGGIASLGLLHLLRDSRPQLSGTRGLWLPLPSTCLPAMASTHLPCWWTSWPWFKWQARPLCPLGSLLLHCEGRKELRWRRCLRQRAQAQSEWQHPDQPRRTPLPTGSQQPPLAPRLSSSVGGGRGGACQALGSVL